MDVDFASLRPWGRGQDTAFEELSCQVHRANAVKRGNRFIRVGTPDGGVEGYEIDATGDEHAVQAKFFLGKPTAKQWADLRESIERAVKTHDRLVGLTVALPADRADPVGAENLIRPGHSHVITGLGAAGSRRGFGRLGRDSGLRCVLRDDRGVLFRLAYLGVTNTLVLLRLLPMSDRDKDAEILALRHQIMVLERQLHGERVQFTRADRAWLAALLHPLPRTALNHLRLLVRPETVLRWHRDLIVYRHARSSRPHRAGRPRTIRSIRRLVLRLASENTTWGYRRIHGELLVLGVKVGASTVWEILKDTGVEPAPERTSSTWAAFLSSQGHAIIAADFFETTTLTGAKLYVLAAIEHATRRVRILGATAHPTAAWVAQTARNLVMDLEDARCPVKYMLRDRDGKYPALFDKILADAGITVVRTGVRIPRMNAIMERWVRTCRRELLDRTLILNQRHLLHALRKYEAFYNEHRPHQGITNARPLAPLPSPITDPDRLIHLNIHRRDRLGGILHEYEHA